MSFAAWALIYALAITYVSVAIGPLGFHYVQRDFGEAWQALLAMKYVEHGSDQRADWMANLAMTVPLGFLCIGAFWTGKTGPQRWIATTGATVCCLIFVIAVKYAQLFFPPRTVTLNYVIAQCLGVLLGIVLFAVTHEGPLSLNWQERDFGARALRVTLRIYAVLLILFLLFPFDFVLSVSDFKDRISELSGFLFSLPGEGRARSIKAALMLANIVETMPIGILLATQKTRSLWRTAVVGLVLMTAVFVATTLVISATTNLVSIILRTMGIVIGAAATTRLRRVDLARARQVAARIVPYAWIPYIIAVLFMNGLVTSHWRSFDAARAALDVRGLLPLWHYYIVSKTQAMASLAVHAVMFAPVGVLLSLRGKSPRAGAIQAAMIAFVFALLVEIGRWLRPGLQPDFNDAVIAAVSAWLAARAMPSIWLMVGSLSRGDETMVGKQPLDQSAA